MEAAIAEWLAWIRRNRTSYTLEQYTRVLTQFRLHRGSPPLASLTIADIEAYLDTLLVDHGHNTANSHLAAIKSFYSWQHKRHGVPDIAADVPRLKKVAPEQRFLTEEEYEAILAVAEPLERDLMQVYGNTGVRRGEMLKLRWRHVSADGHSLFVPCGKGEKARTVPLNPMCYEILSRNRVDDTFAFLRRWGSSNSQDRVCHRLAGRAQIPLFGPHALRHYFATRLLMLGLALKLISLILGHSDVATTERIYLHVLPTHILGATDMLKR